MIIDTWCFVVDLALNGATWSFSSTKKSNHKLSSASHNNHGSFLTLTTFIAACSDLILFASHMCIVITSPVLNLVNGTSLVALSTKMTFHLRNILKAKICLPHARCVHIVRVNPLRLDFTTMFGQGTVCTRSVNFEQGIMRK